MTSTPMEHMRAQQQTQHIAARGFSSVDAGTPGRRGDSEADAEDYYDFLPSDSDSNSDDDDNESSDAQRDATVIERVTQAAAAAVGATDTSAVLTPIGVFGAAGADNKSRSSRNNRAQPSTSPGVLAQVATGAVILTGGKELRVSPASLAQHAARKSQLERALDALSVTPTAHTNSSSSSRHTSSGAALSGEAPFRYHAPLPTSSLLSEDVDMAAPDQSTASLRSVDESDGRASSKATAPAAGAITSKSDADPLYDDAMDDADAQWVARTFRAGATDATLCCPCCFLTVCMDCQRHVRYSNQYRARVAINCRVQKHEVLTYTRDTAQASALPFAKRLQVATASERTSSSGATAVSLLTADEFHPVVCSDCGTTVGVLDREQHFHFFNVLPSTC